MTLPGRDPAAKRVIIGSHLDSVPHGGNFDGAAGVVAGLVAVAALQRSASRWTRDLTVMGIRAEESIWFQVSYIGSRGALGTLPDGALDVRRIDTGRTLAEHIAECGGDPGSAARRRALPRSGATARLSRIAYRAGAEPGGGRSPGGDLHRHSRATSVIPMRASKAATTMLACRAASGATPPWPAPSSPWRSTGCGKSTTRTASRWPALSAASTPTRVARPDHRAGRFHFSLDVRAYDEAVLAELDRQVDAIIAGIEQRRGVRFHLGPKARAGGRTGRSGDQARRWSGRAALEYPGAASRQPGLARCGGICATACRWA